MARRNNDFLHLISLLTLYAILPSDKPKQRRRPVQQVSYNADANDSASNSSNANNGNEGMMMFAFLFMVAGMLSGSGGIFFFCFFVAGGMFLAACCGGSKKNTSTTQVQQGNQAYYNPNVYTYSNGQPSASQQGFVEAQANYANARAAQPFVPINAKHVFGPDATLVGLLQGMHINERMRYLNVDSVDELAQKFPMCLTASELADYNAGKGWILKLRRKEVADKYRYLKGMVPSSPAPAVAAAAIPAAVPMAMYLDDDDDDNVFWSNNNQEQAPAPRPAWQDPHAYHGTEKYDEFYHLREDEYREEYGDDFEDAIDNEYEETYINNR